MLKEYFFHVLCGLEEGIIVTLYAIYDPLAMKNLFYFNLLKILFLPKSPTVQ